jgi:two-component system OmpR family sensor kinase
MSRSAKSIRITLTLWYSTILVTTLVVFGLVAYTYSSQTLSENLDRSLVNEVKWVKGYIQPKAGKVKPSRKYAMKKPPELSQEEIAAPPDEIEPEDPDDEVWNQIYEHALLNPKKTLIEVTDKKGAVIFRSFSASMESLMVEIDQKDTMKLTTVRSDKGKDWRVAASATPELRLYAAYPLSELSDVLDNLFSILLVMIPIALAVSVGGGLFLANKSLRPVDDVTRAAQKITAQNLDQQIPTRGVNDELGRLILTFNDMIKRLRHSFDQITQFSADASHELRTPLTIMRGEVELVLRSPKTSEEYRRVLVSNLDEIMRLSSIIDNLLTLSKGDQDGHDVRFEAVPLRPLMTELLEDSEIIAMKKQISVRLTDNEDVAVDGDALRLRQLVLNLVDNAVKYTPDEGSVTISSRQEEGMAVIRIRDTGIGIPPDEREKIFDRLYRVDKGRSRDMGGSGLGLSISRWIVDLHRGTITVTSEPGEGSEFAVRLPLAGKTG